MRLSTRSAIILTLGESRLVDFNDFARATDDVLFVARQKKRLTTHITAEVVPVARGLGSFHVLELGSWLKVSFSDGILLRAAIESVVGDDEDLPQLKLGVGKERILTHADLLLAVMRRAQPDPAVNLTSILGEPHRDVRVRLTSASSSYKPKMLQKENDLSRAGEDMHAHVGWCQLHPHVDEWSDLLHIIIFT